MSNETATLVKLSAAEQAAAVKKGDVTSRELVEAHLKVIEAAEPSIKAFLKVSGDVALEQADAFDAKSAEDKAALVARALELEACLREAQPDADRVGLLDRDLNLALARMAANPIFEWIMHALQRGFSSHDYTLYDTPRYRERTAANWADTARAIADNDPLRAQSLIGYHYAMLRACLAECPAASAPRVSPDDS